MILLFVWLLYRTMAADAARYEHKRSFYDGADGCRILLTLYKNFFFIPGNRIAGDNRLGRGPPSESALSRIYLRYQIYEK